MSFSQPKVRKTRLQRSVQAVSASKPKLIEEALNGFADCIILDCGDAVAPKDKCVARGNVIEALRGIDWKARGKSISVRINGVDTQYMYRDVIDIVEQAGQFLDSILLPKVGEPGDINVLDCLLSQIEYAFNIPNPIGIEALIETKLGMDNMEAIAKTSPRLEAMHFSITGFAASGVARATVINRLKPKYSSIQCGVKLKDFLVACRAQSLRAIDGPFLATNNIAGFRLAATNAATLGFHGKWVSNSAQIETTNDVMSPFTGENSAKRKMDETRNDVAAQTLDVRLESKVISIASNRAPSIS